MSKIKKLVARFKTQPSDFKWSELVKMLTFFGFNELQGDGSRVKFINKNKVIISLHKPHPKKILKKYQIKNILEVLENERLLEEDL